MNEPKIKATCTWGDGPDVILTLNDKPFILYEDATDHRHYIHGVVKKGSTDLTADEALDLAYQLTMAAHSAKQLDRQLGEYVTKEIMKDQPCKCKDGAKYVKSDDGRLRCMTCKGKVK